MDLTIPIQISTLSNPINYQDNILLMGSCFTEHIGDKLDELKFSVLQNPNGILFDPASVVSSLVSYIQNKQYQSEELFYYNEVWQSWQHHSRFSKTDLQDCLRGINASQQEAHDFLKTANWLVVTLGTSFSYRLTEQVPVPFRRGAIRGAVANNHRTPAGWFNKHMLSIEETTTMLDNCLHQLFQFNPNIKVIFTVSPVRHIRDGVIDNNRSKARLIEVVHHLVNKFDKLYYFPAYELVIDVLRDYRFYDIDMVHPNYQATSFVLDKFMRHFVDEKAQQLAEEIKKIVIARKHKPFQPATEAHKKFLKTHLEKAQELQRKYPFLNLDEDIRYFLQ
jgi:hypothetical protein